MHKIVSLIGLMIGLLPLSAADNRIVIPLTMSVFMYAPMDGPDGSTPDPTDPNQFNASLTGNMLRIDTQEGAVSYVVIQEKQLEKQNEDYFYGLSYGSITCPITHAGDYTIHIGYWKTNFTGSLRVADFSVIDFNGRQVSRYLNQDNLPMGNYIIRLSTNLGTTSTKNRRIQ